MPRGEVVFGRPRSFFDDVAATHELGWWITEKGLWIAQEPPPDIAYVDAYGASAVPQRKGRPSRRPDEFRASARRLWTEALTEAPGGQVSDSQLQKIASELDCRNFIPPSDYLEKSASQEIKRFNSVNSNSKIGPIKTWAELVKHADKDHLRGMRKMLSRCGSTKLSGK
jgi:hypothetical protein